MNAKAAIRSIFWALGAVCVVQPVALGGDPIAPRYSTARIAIEQWQAYLAEVKAIPDSKCTDYVLMQYACDSAVQRTIWVFTRAGHPAHPAVSRGILFVSQVTGGAVLGIDRSGHYVGDRAAFEKWMKEFAALDQRQVGEWGT